ncbi:hypothetical protein Hanom_Chr08g00720261 [Helianthus anomalus]
MPTLTLTSCLHNPYALNLHKTFVNNVSMYVCKSRNESKQGKDHQWFARPLICVMV